MREPMTDADLDTLIGHAGHPPERCPVDVRPGRAAPVVLELHQLDPLGPRAALEHEHAEVDLVREVGDAGRDYVEVGRHLVGDAVDGVERSAGDRGRYV